MDRRQRETGGLAGAGLRDAAQVAALHQRRDRPRLDRGGLRIILGGKRAIDVGVQAKVVKVVIKYSHGATRRRIRSHRTDGARPRVRNDPRERARLWGQSAGPARPRLFWAEITLPVVAAGDPAMLRCTIIWHGLRGIAR